DRPRAVDEDVEVNDVGTASDEDAGHQRERHEDPVVEILVRQLASPPLDSDHLELLTADAHRLPDRRLAREELPPRGGPEHPPAPPAGAVASRDQPPPTGALVLDDAVLRRLADEPRGRLTPTCGDREALDVLVRCDRGHRGELADRLDVVGRDRAVAG